jgi:hypothetical protein
MFGELFFFCRSGVESASPVEDLLRTLILLPLAALLACSLNTAPVTAPEASPDVSQEVAKSGKRDVAPSDVDPIGREPPADEARVYPEDQVMGKDGKAIALSAVQWALFGDVLVHVSKLPDDDENPFDHRRSSVKVDGYGFEGKRFYLKNVQELNRYAEDGELDHFSAGRLEYFTYYESTFRNMDSRTIFQLIPSLEGSFILELTGSQSEIGKFDPEMTDKMDASYSLRVWTKTPAGLKDVATTLLPAGVKTEEESGDGSSKRIKRDYSVSASDSMLQIGRAKYSWDGRRFSRTR